MWYFPYVVNIESWSPSNSKMYRPTTSATPTDLADSGKKHKRTCTEYVNVHMMSSDSIHVDLPYRVLIHVPSVVTTAIIFVFVLIVIMALCRKK